MHFLHCRPCFSSCCSRCWGQHKYRSKHTCGDRLNCHNCLYWYHRINNTFRDRLLHHNLDWYNCVRHNLRDRQLYHSLDWYHFVSFSRKQQFGIPER